MKIYEKYISEASGKCITDFGKSHPLTTPDGKVFDTLPRYAVWSNTGRKDEVIETSNDLKYLKKKYGDLPVIPIGRK